MFKDQIISIEKGTDLLGSEDNVGIPLIKMGNIKRGYFSFNKLEKLREIETIQEKYYIKKGDFLFNTRNTMELVGKSATWTNESGKFAFNSNVARLVLKGIDTYFFNYLYNTSKMINKVKSLAVGTTSVAAIYPRDLNHLNYFLPLIAEQEKIGEFFSKLDRQIELEEQKLSLLEEQKKGYMQKLFSQELSFKDGNSKDYPEWEETTVKEIASITTGNKDTKDAIENGKYEFYVRSPKIHKFNSYSFDGEAVLTVGDGVGVGKVFHYVNGKFDYHQRVYKISDFNNYNALLFYYYFSTHFLREAQKYNAKTSVDSVRRDMIINMKIPNIIIEEQGKISNFLSKLDELINKHGQKIDDLKIRKQGFLQKMFV